MRLIIFLVAVSVLAAAPPIHSQTAAPSPTPSAAASPSPAKHHRAKGDASPATAATGAAPGTVASPTPKSSHKKPAAPAASAAPAVSATGNPAASPSPARHGLFSTILGKATPAASASPALKAPAKKEVPTSNATPAPGGGNGLVWVNTKTHVYHKEGSAWYGKTKEGKYLSEQDAIKEGDKASGKNEKANQGTGKPSQP